MFNIVEQRREKKISRVKVTGVICYASTGTMKVPSAPGSGGELDPDRFAKTGEAYERYGDISIYAEDMARHWTAPVKSRW